MNPRGGALCALTFALVTTVPTRVRAAEGTTSEPDDDASVGDAPTAEAATPSDARPNEAEPVEVEQEAGQPEDASGPIEVSVQGPARPRTASEVRRDRRVLEAAPHRTASDLLRTLPGVFLTQHSGEGKAHQIFFRGFDAVHGQDVEISVGGVPVNEVSNVHGQGYADLHFIMPEVVDEVVARPGAIAVDQGDFAVAGSMAFRLGLDQPGVRASASYGSWNTARAFAAYRPVGQPEGTFVAGEVYRTEGFGVARGAERANTVGQVVVPLAAGIFLRGLFTAAYGRFDAPGVLVQRDIDAGAVSRFASYDPEQGGRSLRSQVSAALVVDRDAWQAEIQPYLIERHLDLRFNFTGDLDDPEVGDNRRQRHGATTIGMHGRVEHRFSLVSHTDTVAVGGSLRHDIIDQRHVATRGRRSFVDASVNASHMAGWAEATTRLIPRTILRGGMRVDGVHFDVHDRLAPGRRSASGVVASPRTSFDVAILPELHALAGYGMGLRTPQARSISDGEPANFTRAHSLELGFRGRYKALKVSAAGFASLLDQDLVFDETTSRNEASPATLRGGLAADLEVREGDLALVTLGGSYTRATFREDGGRFAAGDLVPFVPQVVLRSDAALTPEVHRMGGHALRAHVGLGLSGLFIRPLAFGTRGEDVVLLDTRLGLEWNGLSLMLDATNVANARWYDGQFVYASSFGAQPTAVPRRHVSAGAPRRFLATFAVRFGAS